MEEHLVPVPSKWPLPILSVGFLVDDDHVTFTLSRCSRNRIPLRRYWHSQKETPRVSSMRAMSAAESKV